MHQSLMFPAAFPAYSVTEKTQGRKTESDETRAGVGAARGPDAQEHKDHTQHVVIPRMVTG